MLLYHTGYQEIRKPDIHYGRKNADFGQGFYLTANRDFACRWAKEQRGMLPVLNTYELTEEGLAIHRFNRDDSWFGYIFSNRAGKEDTLPADVVIGPIANDTIYDTFGIITSGFLRREMALKLLLIGPLYEQIVIKTEKAASLLKWLSAQEISSADSQHWKEVLAAEEAEYQKLFAKTMEEGL